MLARRSICWSYWSTTETIQMDMEFNILLQMKERKQRMWLQPQAPFFFLSVCTGLKRKFQTERDEAFIMYDLDDRVSLMPKTGESASWLASVSRSVPSIGRYASRHNIRPAFAPRSTPLIALDLIERRLDLLAKYSFSTSRWLLGSYNPHLGDYHLSLSLDNIGMVIQNRSSETDSASAGQRASSVSSGFL